MWTEDIENILLIIKDNSDIYSEYYKQQYFFFKSKLIYYKIPIIILNGLNSIFSIGLTIFLDQETVSIINCLISLCCSIITSIELYLSINKNMEDSMNSSREFKLLSMDIYKITKLDREHRQVDPKLYLDEKYNQYCKLIESSNLVDKKIKDKINDVPKLEKVKSVLTIALPSPNNSDGGSNDII